MEMVLSIRCQCGYRRRPPLTSVTKRENVGRNACDGNFRFQPSLFAKVRFRNKDYISGSFSEVNSVYRKGRFSHRSRSDVAANDELHSNASNVVPIDDFPPYQPSNDWV